MLLIEWFVIERLFTCYLPDGPAANCFVRYTLLMFKYPEMHAKQPRIVAKGLNFFVIPLY